MFDLLFSLKKGDKIYNASKMHHTTIKTLNKVELVKCSKLHFSWFDVRTFRVLLRWYNKWSRGVFVSSVHSTHKWKWINASRLCVPCKCGSDNKTELRGNIVQLNCFRNEFSQKPMTSDSIHMVSCSIHANMPSTLIWIVFTSRHKQTHIHT